MKNDLNITKQQTVLLGIGLLSFSTLVGLVAPAAAQLRSRQTAK
ncbi:MAG TPA: hypothetical protein VGB45_07245 [Abditibacterium sp.]|jgi:hypothetical protein